MTLRGPQGAVAAREAQIEALAHDLARQIEARAGAVEARKSVRLDIEIPGLSGYDPEGSYARQICERAADLLGHAGWDEVQVAPHQDGSGTIVALLSAPPEEAR